MEREVFNAPALFCLYNNYEGMMAFFGVVEKKIYVQGGVGVIDFSKVETFTAAAVLYLVSVVNRCQLCANTRGVSPDFSLDFRFKDDQQLMNLRDAGLWDAIKPGGLGKLKELAKDRKNPFYSGNKPRKDYESALDKYFAMGFDVVPAKLSSAVQEAYLNIMHHSYDPAMTPYNIGYPQTLDQRSWFYTYLKEQTGQIVFLLLDRGCGIPVKVGAAIGQDQTYRLGGSIPFGAMIEKAMEQGFTTTGLPGRGRGSKNIRRPIEIKTNGDTLLIYSGKGSCLYKDHQVVYSRWMTQDFNGTLLEWALEV